MARTRKRTYGVFNVVAQPHPENIYREIFQRSVGRGVKYWGDYYAAITPLSEIRDNIFTGRLVIWMAVDPDSNVVNLKDFVEEPLSESSDVVVPEDRGLNSRTFQFAFNTKDHRLFLELVNDERKTVSPRRAETAFQKALEDAAYEQCEEFRVQIQPTSDSVERILSIPRLNSVEMRLYRPNPDSIDPEAQELLEEELEGQNAKEAVKTLKKAPSFKSLMLNTRNKLLARAAAYDGLVKGKGKSEDGKSVEASTKDYPYVITRDEDEVGTEAGSIRSVAKQG
ncbi:DUF4747 family protein [uncultured Roseovarius sp.]|uniref:DUF4747 family protein n=1 Tax=uncultured Roseovarius sp. TaxID=293344 RepID=UPI0025D0EC9F|nr:DUF4747 family protein [uncultured Roseovarius sp.]